MRRTLAATAVLLSASLASAHGGLPVSQHILRQSGGDQMFVPVVFWGLWVSQPDGRWKWICEEMINQNRFRKFALSTDGAFYTTDVKGLTQSTDNGCTWKPATGTIANLHTTDVDVDPVDGATAYCSTGDGGTITDDGGEIPAVNAVFVTHDHGANWTPLAGLAAQSSRLFDSVHVAPSSGQILYASSNNQTPPYAIAIHRSADAGANFTTTTLTYQVDSVDPHALEILAVDPRDPNVVWARATAEVPEGSSTVTRHGLIRTSDGGTTWSELYKLDAVTESSGQTRGIDGVAFDITNNRVYVATRTGLLSGSDDGSATVPTLAPTGTLSQTQCVDVHGGALNVCSSQFPPDNAAIAQSIDNGQSFHSILNYVDTVGPVDCPAGTPVGDLCPSYWYMYGAQLGITFDGGTGGGPDAGMMPPKGGCGCTVGAVESAVGGVAFACLLLALALRTIARSEGRARRRD